MSYKPTTFSRLDVGRELGTLEEFERRLIPEREPKKTRPPGTPDERELWYEFLATAAAQDLFIVQATALGFGVVEDADLHTLLTRQIGDDGRHSSYMRESVVKVTGRDPLEDIQRRIQRHWDMVGDLIRQGFVGWLAFEIDYEFYAVPEIVVATRTLEIVDTSLFDSGADFGGDEAFHRAFLAAWWRNHLATRTPAERQDLIGRLLEYDREFRARKADYYQEFIEKMEPLGSLDWPTVNAITNVWHQKSADYLLPSSAN